MLPWCWSAMLIRAIRGLRDDDSNRKLNMYAITGITGKVGGAVARALLADGQSVLAVVRNADKGQVWRERGCKVALATIEDAASLSAAFQGADAVFVLVPPNFDPSPEFSDARETGKALHCALAAAHPKRVVYLSTIGAQARETNLLSQHSHYREGDRRLAHTYHILASGLVYGELPVGCSSRARNGCRSQFFAPAR